MFQSTFIRIIYAICILVVFFIIACYGLSDIWSKTCVAVIVAAMLLYAFRIFLFANYKYKSTPLAKEESFWKIDEKGIETKATSYSSTILWNAIIKITESKSWVFIWYSKSRFLYFQKDLVTSEELRTIKTAFFEARKKAR
jgi:hypothetical protein